MAVLSAGGGRPADGGRLARGAHRARPLAAFVLRRVGLGLLALLGAATLTFFALRAVPGDPALVILGAGQSNVVITPEAVQAVRAEYHLDDPLLLQYLQYMGRLFTGDLGESYKQQTAVGPLIAAQVLPTASLTALAALVAVVVSVALAVLTAGRRAAGAVSSFHELVLSSVPVFWLGFLLLLLLSFRLRLLPAVDDGSFAALVLPALTLGLPAAAPLTQVLRRGLDDVLEQPFMTTARARGARRTAALVGHGLRHALVPWLTMLGYTVGALLGGAVITETLFNRPGLGRLLVNAVTGQDLPLVIAVVLLCTVVFVVVNIVIDVLYAVVDPRIEGARR